MVEHVLETWVPGDRDVEWLHRRTTAGNYRWIVGSDAEAEEYPLAPIVANTEEYRAVRGEFFGPAHPGSWQIPDPEFLAGLATVPAALFRKLRGGHGGPGQDPDLEMLVYVADVLRPGLVPAHVRTTLYRTLEMVPGMEIAVEDRVVFGMTRKGWW